LYLFDSLSQILEIITARDGYLPLFYMLDYSINSYYLSPYWACGVVGQSPTCDIFVSKINRSDNIVFPQAKSKNLIPTPRWKWNSFAMIIGIAFG